MSRICKRCFKEFDDGAVICPVCVKKDYADLLSRVKEARKEIEKVGTEKWKDYKQNHTGSYDEGYSDAADAFVSLLDRLVPEAKGEE